ncbi:iron chelate uptake ABC transporter family permease subunit, partial [Tropicimonas sp.]|uniref:iron chelate uptake ABC transporter family permease subunit n=1 Tax=Tropicimonas sp. TaxID=2067044 RepID=UPI003A870445
MSENRPARTLWRRATGGPGPALPLIAVLAAAFLVGAVTGPFDLSPSEIARLLADRLTGNETGGVEAAVFFNIRLPRVMAAALVGAALAAAGASYQTIFRN